MGDVLNAQAVHNRGEPKLQVGIRGDAFLMSLENGFVTITNPETGQSMNLKGKITLETDNGAVDLQNYVSNVQAADSVPQMDGTAAFGSSSKYARMDHVHPSDTSKENTSNKVTSISASSTDTQYPSAKAVYTELNTVKTSVSDGKSAIASAITDKGVSTSSSDSFATMASNIESITTGPDTSGDTVTAGTMLAGITAHDKDGNPITGNIQSKSSSDMTVSGATVTAPAGYYASAQSKSVATATQATPSISVNASGLITASATQSAGYVSAGTKSATQQLTAKGTTTYNTSTSDQTIASGQYLTGTQTIRKVTTSNLTAANIKKGVTVKVGDAGNAGRIVNITGTYAGAGSTFSGTYTNKGSMSVTQTTLSLSRSYLTGASVGSYALCMGGATYSSSWNACTTVDAYDTSLTHSSPSGLGNSARSSAGASVGSYALCMGGHSSSKSSLYYVYAYDTSLTRSSPTRLNYSRGDSAGTSVSSYALCMGGVANGSSYNTYLNYVEAYDTSLTRSTATALSAARSALAGASVGNYALAMGGLSYSSGYSYYSTVDAYNTSLTRTTATELSVGRYSLAGASVGNYALAMGGTTGSSYSSAVDAYDTSLTRTTLTELSVARSALAGVSVGNYALAMGGYTYNSGTSTYYSTVDAYDTSLTRTTLTELSVGRSYLAGASVGNYALAMGGTTRSTYDSSSNVDAYNSKTRIIMDVDNPSAFGTSGNISGNVVCS